MIATKPYSVIANEPVDSSVDPFSFLHGRAGTWIEQLMGELAFEAKGALLRKLPDIDEIDIWSLAVELFTLDGIKRRIDGHRYDTIESGSLKTVFSLSGEAMINHADDDDLPEVIQMLLPIVSCETRKQTKEYIMNKLLPAVQQDLEAPGNIAYPTDGRQVGRTKRMRFLYLESGIQKNALDMALTLSSGKYVSDVFATLAPLRTAVYIFLTFAYQTIWKKM